MHGGHIGYGGGPLCARYSQRCQATCIHEIACGQDTGDTYGGDAGHDIRHEWCATFVRHTHHIQLLGIGIHRANELGHVLGAAVGVGLGLLAHSLGELNHGLGREGRRGHKDQWGVGHDGHAGQIFERIVRHALGDERIDQVCGHHHHKGVAIRIGLGDDVGTDDAVGTGLVFNNDGLLEQGAETLGQLARNNVGATACGIRDDDANRFGRPVGGLSLGNGRACGE